MHVAERWSSTATLDRAATKQAMMEDSSCRYSHGEVEDEQKKLLHVLQTSLHSQKPFATQSTPCIIVQNSLNPYVYNTEHDFYTALQNPRLTPLLIVLKPRLRPVAWTGPCQFDILQHFQPHKTIFSSLPLVLGGP